MLRALTSVDGVDAVRSLRIDKSIRGLYQIPYEHHEIHAGSSYHLITYSDNLNADASINISFLTHDSTKEPHLIWLFDSSGEYLSEVLSAPTITAGTGSAAAPSNANFRSTNTSLMTCKTGVTITSDGTVIYRRYVASGKNVGVIQRANEERILAANTQYVFRLTSKTNASKAHIELSWYEHTPKG
jgi:hypothetical protein